VACRQAALKNLVRSRGLFGYRLRPVIVFGRLVIGVIVVVVTVAIRRFAACAQRTGVGSVEAAFQFNGNLFVDRAGMRLLLVHAQFGQHVDDNAGLHLKLPSQLVNSDFLHRRDCWITPYNSLFCGELVDLRYGIRFKRFESS
jgi:hypothetical protein